MRLSSCIPPTPRRLSSCIPTYSFGAFRSRLAQDAPTTRTSGSGTMNFPPRFRNLEPFANYVAPVGPEVSLSAVRQRALQEAQGIQDEDLTSISVSTGSLQAALEVMHPQSMPTSVEETASTGEKDLPASTVYLVEMRGNFTLTNAHVPPGQPFPHGSVLELLLDAHTGELEDAS